MTAVCSTGSAFGPSRREPVLGFVTREAGVHHHAQLGDDPLGVQGVPALGGRGWHLNSLPGTAIYNSFRESAVFFSFLTTSPTDNPELRNRQSCLHSRLAKVIRVSRSPRRHYGVGLHAE